VTNGHANHALCVLDAAYWKYLIGNSVSVTIKEKLKELWPNSVIHTDELRRWVQGRKTYMYIALIYWRLHPS
jgi:hypothetical protein